MDIVVHVPGKNRKESAASQLSSAASTSGFSQPIIVSSPLSNVSDNGGQSVVTASPIKQDVQFVNFAEQPYSNFMIPMGINNTPSAALAVPYFFRNYVLSTRHADSQKGFLELLTEMWDETRPSSLLHQATYAIGLATMSNNYKSKEMRLDARREYGKALQQLGVAIQNPKVTTTDELLMTTLLCSLYEVSILLLPCKNVTEIVRDS